MKLCIVLLALACASVVSAQAQATLYIAEEDPEYKVPGDNPFYFYQNYKGHILQLSSLDLDPNPPKPGQKLKVSATGNLIKVVKIGACADVTVKLGLFTLLKKEFDICEEAKNATEKDCPYDAGSWSFEKEVDLPKEIPPAKFAIEMQAYTIENEDLTGMYGTVDFTRNFGSME